LKTQTLRADDTPTEVKTGVWLAHRLAIFAGSVTRRQLLPPQCLMTGCGNPLPLGLTLRPVTQASDALLAPTLVKIETLPRTANVASVRQPVVAACAGIMPAASVSALPARTMAARREESLITDAPVTRRCRGDKTRFSRLRQ
jgi:hypothetical protein